MRSPELVTIERILHDGKELEGKMFNKISTLFVLLFVCAVHTYAQSDYLVYTVGEKTEIPLPERIDRIETKYLVNLKWGSYSGPQSRVMVLPIENLAARRRVSVNEIEAIVIDVINQTGRFRLVERQVLNSVLGEQDLGESGRVARPSAAKIGKVLGAQYMMKVVITDFEEDVEGSKGGGIGGVFKRAAAAGGVGISKSESRVGMAFRLIDAETSEVLFTKQIESRIKKSGLKIGGGLIGGRAFGGAVYSKYTKTPIGQAVIAGVNKGVFELVKQIGSLPATGRVIKAAGNKVWINIGNEVVSSGDVLKVESKGEEMIDPDTGISLGSDDTEIGTIRVSNAQGKFSIAEIVSISGTVNRGDRVISTIPPPPIQFADRWEKPKRGKF